MYTNYDIFHKPHTIVFVKPTQRAIAPISCTAIHF